MRPIYETKSTKSRGTTPGVLRGVVLGIVILIIYMLTSGYHCAVNLRVLADMLALIAMHGPYSCH